MTIKIEEGWEVNKLAERLAHRPIFESLNSGLILALAKIAKRKHYSRGTTIHHEREATGGFYFIETGHVKVVRHIANGKEHILRFFQAEDTFNEVTIVDRNVNPATVIALTDTVAWLFPIAAVSELVAQHKNLHQIFARLVALHSRDLVMMVEELALLPVQERLARFLLRNIVGNEFDNEDAVPRFFTFKEIANHLGTAREVISRHLSRFKKIGVINVKQDKIVICDKNQLTQIAYANK